MTRVLVMGGVTWDTVLHLDHFPEPQPQTIFSQGFHETLGGTGAGKALNLARLGFDVTLHALLGDDAVGERAAQTLTDVGVHLLAETDPLGTERHVNLLDDQGRRISIYANSATFEPDIDLSGLEAQIPRHDILVINIINYTRRLIPAARQLNMPIWCDLHDYDGESDYHQDYVDAATYLVFSSDAMPDFRPFMHEQVQRGKQLVVCTHGKEGATALSAEGRWYETPIIDAYEQVDTSGAGDSFFAGVLYGFSQGYDVERCMRLGAIVGGLCVTVRELGYPDLSPARVEAEYARHFDT
jgi:sugar/nucleoside kinase (ribokinase family)